MASAVKVLHVCTIQLTAQVFIAPIARYLRARAATRSVSRARPRTPRMGPVSRPVGR